MMRTKHPTCGMIILYTSMHVFLYFTALGDFPIISMRWKFTNPGGDEHALNFNLVPLSVPHRGDCSRARAGGGGGGLPMGAMVLTHDG